LPRSAFKRVLYAHCLVCSCIFLCVYFYVFLSPIKYKISSSFFANSLYENSKTNKIVFNSFSHHSLSTRYERDEKLFSSWNKQFWWVTTQHQFAFRWFSKDGEELKIKKFDKLTSSYIFSTSLRYYEKVFNFFNKGNFFWLL
jgi:hypothetical protein